MSSAASRDGGGLGGGLEGGLEGGRLGAREREGGREGGREGASSGAAAIAKGKLTVTLLARHCPSPACPPSARCASPPRSREHSWYGNVPDPAPKGQCGGGAFRAIEVLIDGQVAGLAFPFPVLYTGGENPLLWHPLTGIMSFDVVPYRFDVTPFVATLNDGEAHSLEIRVLHEQSTGVWYADAALLLWRGVGTAAVTGGIISHSSPPLNVQESTTKVIDLDSSFVYLRRLVARRPQLTSPRLTSPRLASPHLTSRQPPSLCL